MSSKLDSNWLTHYVIIEQTTPVSFKVRNQLTGAVSRVHADALRLANTEWIMPEHGNANVRRNRLVESPPNSSINSDISEAEMSSDDDQLNEGRSQLSRHSDCDSDETEIYDPNEWIKKGKLREQKIREDTESEQDIPKFELRRSTRIRNRQALTQHDQSDSETSESVNLIDRRSRKNKYTKKRKLTDLIGAITKFL